MIRFGLVKCPSFQCNVARFTRELARFLFCCDRYLSGREFGVSITREITKRRCRLVFHEGLGALAARATTVLAPSHLCAAVLSFCHLCFQTTATPADLLTLSNPPAAGATLNMRPAPLPLEDMEWRQTPPPLTTAPGTFRLRRGSRFTWRKECLAVMER